MSTPTVGAVVLNWNDAASTIACVRSLLGGSRRPDALVVVDNGSDHACHQALLSARTDLDFELVRSEKNLGYGGGNNVGLRRLGHLDHVLVLNNDTVVDSDAVAALVAALEARPEAGLVAPLVVTEEDRVWFAGGHLNRWRGLPVHHSFGRHRSQAAWAGCTEISFATGCAILVRQEVLRAVGLINESFFLYWEDVELCQRILGAGWKILFCPAARVVHRRGQSSDPMRNLSPTMLRYSTRNRLLYLRTFEAGLPRAVALLYTAVNTAGTLRRVARLRGVDRRARLVAVLRGLREGVRLPPLTRSAPAWGGVVPTPRPASLSVTSAASRSRRPL